MATDLTDASYLGYCANCNPEWVVEICAICNLCVRVCCPGTCATDYPADDPCRPEFEEED